jgi:hypothetical protein
MFAILAFLYAPGRCSALSSGPANGPRNPPDFRVLMSDWTSTRSVSITVIRRKRQSSKVKPAQARAPSERRTPRLRRSRTRGSLPCPLGCRLRSSLLSPAQRVAPRLLLAFLSSRLGCSGECSSDRPRFVEMTSFTGQLRRCGCRRFCGFPINSRKLGKG